MAKGRKNRSNTKVVPSRTRVIPTGRTIDDGVETPNPVVAWRRVDALTPYAGNARTHSDKQIGQIADSIEAFGFTNPVLLDSSNTVVVSKTWQLTCT